MPNANLQSLSMSYQKDCKEENLLLHPATNVEWLGFRGKLGDMSRAGWLCELLSRDYDQSVQIIFRHRHIPFVGQCRPISRYELMQFRGSQNIEPHMPYPMPAHITLQVEYSSRIQIHGVSSMDYSLGNVNVGERYPDGSVYLIEPYVHEKDEPEEIIIMPEDIPEWLEKIRKVQEPMAKELLAKQRKREQLSNLTMKAKILTFDKQA